MKSILWVEDDVNFFNIFSSFLKNKYKINRAEDYEDALNNLKDKQFDLIIIDLIIPSGEKLSIDELINIKDRYFGLELIKHIRENDTKTPIMVVSVVNKNNIIDSIKIIDNKIPILWKYDISPKEIETNVNTILKYQSSLGK